MRVPLRPRDIWALIIVGAFALSASGTHVVRSGETLGSIAQRNGTTVQALVEANGIANPNLIMAGTTLKLPGSATGGGSAAASHTVRAGDTLASIAARYGTTVSAIASANGIANPNLIVVGRSLQISGAARPSTTTPGATSGGPQLAGQRHTVQRGDTIAGIAARYGIRTADLIAWNGLVDGKIYDTTRLVLFNPGTLPAIGGSTSTPGGTHVVQSGQSLSGIASRYGVSASAIASANGISDPNRIRVGQTLTIPGSSGGGGGFVCPVPGATFFNDWGFPRSGGRSHAGTDLFAARGTPVRAPVGGQVGDRHRHHRGQAVPPDHAGRRPLLRQPPRRLRRQRPGQRRRRHRLRRRHRQRPGQPPPPALRGAPERVGRQPVPPALPLLLSLSPAEATRVGRGPPAPAAKGPVARTGSTDPLAWFA